VHICCKYTITIRVRRYLLGDKYNLNTTQFPELSDALTLRTKITTKKCFEDTVPISRAIDGADIMNKWTTRNHSRTDSRLQNASALLQSSGKNVVEFGRTER
jgi:hypothetical protein